MGFDWKSWRIRQVFGELPTWLGKKSSLQPYSGWFTITVCPCWQATFLVPIFLIHSCKDLPLASTSRLKNFRLSFFLQNRISFIIKDSHSFVPLKMIKKSLKDETSWKDYHWKIYHKNNWEFPIEEFWWQTSRFLFFCLPKEIGGIILQFVTVVSSENHPNPPFYKP